MAEGTVLGIPDTNTIVRYLVHDDPVHSPEADIYFAAVRTGEREIFLSEAVLAECVYILTQVYRVPRAQAAAALSGLLRYRGVVNADRRIHLDALKVFGAGTLSIVDCLLLARAREMRAELFTFDHALRRHLKHHPSEIPPDRA